MRPERKPDNLIGQSNSFSDVLEQVSQIAPLDKPVLIIGERGTGKELIAARCHYLSRRWQQQYVTLNCAALNENLLDSELFGHEAGAFTGAAKKHEGRFERADSGSLFLDELANTSLRVQEKLLRVIEYGEFERVGGRHSVKVDTRLIAATNEDLPSLAAKGQFRSDLLDRLAFDVITLPPLRERRDDIMLLAEHFAISMAREMELELFSGFSEKARKTLLEYHWPGNVRELKNTVERSLYRLGNGHVPIHDIIIDPFNSPFRPKTPVTEKAVPQEPVANEQSNAESNELIDMPKLNAEQPIDFKQKSQEYEIDVLSQALRLCQFNQKKTANFLGLTYHQLRGYLKKYQLLEGASAAND
ncbi:phage shock protein operon transcriptional activator [Idiomarina loihiensis]|jgi:psp operon transcriptional activator|uniref:Transcriptional regulator, AtoC family (AAA,HTH domains) n=1 Tax=Idiomarina loihiensis (strain ATCC BAA-735 / DSM 15497 / L2-TR) TaxID=283942 RepID=Q5QUD6_IDILO|nr:MULTISPECIES: phage shock protein operon transcriptional activator [Idiomarina]AAV81573.1 Transcriptional regulator, AtoC family (AAA,HTH domains) [Idiomarina loihiensis L2TR]AGM35601.1 transcriptional regulator [Idiomarina loihiensis GSL 199]MAA61760.1 phage shock protein operon transcriptional activator [Idiomarina sp.]MBL4855737.1 phage shock protein operon transcriptional activator [Idiomarina sp.]MRJ43805.1 phage shock protein operon transcriptional activator [Idiomarina loihiensis]|tara:strand:+ start:66984 stop:68060 length:1077 start_codon:yes stop_codon:yes gene_type:complete